MSKTDKLDLIIENQADLAGMLHTLSFFFPWETEMDKKRQNRVNKRLEMIRERCGRPE